MLDQMKVLGVTFTDPADEGRVRASLVGSLADAVVGPIRRLTNEVRGGACKGTALFLFRRYILPVLGYHQGAWGLLAPRDAWQEVDGAIDNFCEALCPVNLRGNLGPGSPLRRELALPSGLGGLGIPVAADEAPAAAAAQWSREQARAAGARPELIGAAYRRSPGSAGTLEWQAVPAAAHHRRVATALHAEAGSLGRRRLEQNAMRGGARAFAVVPWRPDLSIDNVEFDVAWRLVFGGMPAETMARIDHPGQAGHRWRGERMEWALAEALHDSLPPGSVTTGRQPAPEVIPPGAPAPGLAERADVDVLTKKGTRYVFDVRTINVQCASARTTAETQCAAAEVEKIRHYDKYYRNFAPFVITLSGAVTQASARALGEVMKTVKAGGRYTLDWEPARWLEAVLQRLAIEMVKTVAIVATRAVLDWPTVPRGHRARREAPWNRAVPCRDALRVMCARECRAVRDPAVTVPGARSPGAGDVAAAPRCANCHSV